MLRNSKYQLTYNQELSPVGLVQPADSAECVAERPAVLAAHQQQNWP